MERVGYWLQEIRGPFLALSVVLVFLGTSVAAAEGMFDLSRALLAVAGLVLLHISVNVLNEHSDYVTGIDFDTNPTPFSGGSGMLTAGHISASSAYAVGVISLAMGVAIGLFFVWVTNLRLFPLLLIGGIAVYFYTTVFARHMVGELFAGLGLGFLPILGASFIQTGHYSTAAFAVAVPAGLLTFNLLLINELPDLEADRKGGRRNLVTAFGPEPAGKLYSVLMASVYVWIVAAVALKLIPAYALIALLTIFIAWKPMTWTWSHVGNKEAMVPALGANVAANLATQALLGMGFLASV
jgi:1,4-dihydroxy-2-naphthoate polyprenyltransferase